ncbi:MAG: hypothetical protein PHU46_17120 [Rhodocyclaceae bacterium]|nr:hypothetical protein [Rhodocyclaceae bacterium]
MRKRFLPGLALSMLFLVRGALALDISVLQGWNLIANPGSQVVNIATTFGNASAPVSGVTENVQSIWAWNPVTRNWAFYTPTQADGGAAYAAQKGYEFLGVAPVGQGFWINATNPFSFTLANIISGSTLGNFVGNYAGSYSGTATYNGYSVTDFGTWTATVSTSGVATGSIHSNAFGLNAAATGQIRADGSTTLTFGAVNTGAVFSGTANPFSGQFSGTWVNGAFSGSFTGTRQ